MFPGYIAQHSKRKRFVENPVEVSISATVHLPIVYNRARIRWRRGGHRGATRLVDLCNGFASITEAIGFATTMLYSQQPPKRGYVKKKLALSIHDSRDDVLGHLNIDVASIYTKMKSSAVTSIDRVYDVQTAAGTAAIELAITITDLSHAVPLSVAPSAAGSICTSSASSDGGTGPDGPTSLPPRYSSRLANAEAFSLTPIVEDSRLAMLSAVMEADESDCSLSTLGRELTQASLPYPANPCSPGQALSLSDIRDDDIDARAAEIANLTLALEEQTAAQRVQLFDRMVMLSDPVYTPGGTPVLATAIHRCLAEWGGLDVDPDPAHSALELLSSRLWAARSSMATVLHMACTAAHLYRRIAGQVVLSCVRPAPDDSVESRLGALVHEAVWFAHCNIAHDFKGVVPALLDFPLTTDAPLDRAGLVGLIRAIEADCDTYHLPRGLRSVLFRQFYRHVASLLFNHIIRQRQGSLCTVSTGLRVQILVTELTPLVGDAVDELDVLRQLGDVLLMSKRGLLDPATRARVCPALNLLQIDQVVSLFRPDSMGPEPVDPRLKNEVNLLVARHFVELERLDVELDTMDLPPFMVDCGFDSDSTLTREDLLPEISDSSLFNFLI
ncbi:hypothetical protein J8273_5653 [Carpediemonas membranifera]|uniref:Dilute domain-containing protein n=1 Tax=Carpediemonas membranifera TaxID=201153 RepID=A0A8J6B2N1_9EUKA|nr:hypothetical protein J8273_5653 [Carpediemonas membranifera]|eukprot:KAG9392944.1 hypothetical protein J8273_5653 [Carpediemonas membranifera]